MKKIFNKKAKGGIILVVILFLVIIGGLIFLLNQPGVSKKASGGNCKIAEEKLRIERSSYNLYDEIEGDFIGSPNNTFYDFQIHVYRGEGDYKLSNIIFYIATESGEIKKFDMTDSKIDGVKVGDSIQENEFPMANGRRLYTFINYDLGSRPVNVSVAAELKGGKVCEKSDSVGLSSGVLI